MLYLTPKQNIGIINSANSSDEFEDNWDPFVFSHITDIHLNSFNTKHNLDFEKALNLSQSYGATSVIFTGDLVDNWGAPEDGFFGYGNSYEPDYINLKSVLDKYNFTELPLLDIPGNHDEYGVLGLDSKNHYFIHYSPTFNASKKNYTKQTFWVDTLILANNTFIYVNPFEWPMPHAKLGFWINAGKELLDCIENALKQPYNTTHRFLVTHFPVHLWATRFKSSSGKSFKQLIGEYPIDMIFSGHTHPPSSTPQHFNGTLEVVGPDVLNHNKFALVINDNNRLSYHDISINNPETCFVTYPIAKEHISKQTDFSSQVNFVRVLAFTEKKLTINYQIGDVQGTLTDCRKISDGVYLYSALVSPKPGFNTVTLSGDFNKTVEFFHGEPSVDLGKEYIYGGPDFVTPSLILFGIFLVLDLFITYPSEPFDWVKPFEEWLDGGNADLSFGFVFCMILFGFFTVRNRLQVNSLVVVITLFVLALAPAVIPSVFFVDNGTTLGAVWIWGYAIQGKYHYDVYGTIFGAIYYNGILILIILGAALLTKKSLFLFGFGIFSILCGIFAGIYTALVFGIQSAGYVFGVLSPLFVILPIIGSIIVVVASIKRRKTSNSEFLPLN